MRHSVSMFMLRDAWSIQIQVLKERAADESVDPEIEQN